MLKVNTVLGPIHPDELGVTALPAGVISPCPASVPDQEWWRLVPRLFGKWEGDLNDYKNLGGRTVVASLGTGIKRDMELYRLLARATGINIIVSTGVSDGSDIGSAPRDIDYCGEVFFNELTQEMGPTRVKAGLIEVGISRQKLNELDETVLRAAARTIKRTGCGLMLHGIFTAGEQIAILREEGADPGRIVIADCDDGAASDLDRDKEFCRNGFYVGYTRVGNDPARMASPQAVSDFLRADMIKEMTAAGFIDRLIVSAGPAPVGAGGEWAAPYNDVTAGAMLRLIPKLYRVYLSDGDIDRILIENPKKVLAF